MNCYRHDCNFQRSPQNYVYKFLLLYLNLVLQIMYSIHCIFVQIHVVQLVQKNNLLCVSHKALLEALCMYYKGIATRSDEYEQKLFTGQHGAMYFVHR